MPGGFDVAPRRIGKLIEQAIGRVVGNNRAVEIDQKMSPMMQLQE
jgi:hypothetical protein